MESRACPPGHATFAFKFRQPLANDTFNATANYPDQLLSITLAPSHSTFGV